MAPTRHAKQIAGGDLYAPAIGWVCGLRRLYQEPSSANLHVSLLPNAVRARVPRKVAVDSFQLRIPAAGDGVHVWAGSAGERPDVLSTDDGPGDMEPGDHDDRDGQLPWPRAFGAENPDPLLDLRTFDLGLLPTLLLAVRLVGLLCPPHSVRDDQANRSKDAFHQFVIGIGRIRQARSRFHLPLYELDPADGRVVPAASGIDYRGGGARNLRSLEYPRDDVGDPVPHKQNDRRLWPLRFPRHFRWQNGLDSRPCDVPQRDSVGGGRSVQPVPEAQYAPGSRSICYLRTQVPEVPAASRYLGKLSFGVASWRSHRHRVYDLWQTWSAQLLFLDRGVRGDHFVGSENCHEGSVDLGRRLARVLHPLDSAGDLWELAERAIGAEFHHPRWGGQVPRRTGGDGGRVEEGSRAGAGERDIGCVTKFEAQKKSPQPRRLGAGLYV